jgi:hypothetical protein
MPPQGVIRLISFTVGCFSLGNLQNAATEGCKQEASELLVNYINAHTLSCSYGCRSLPHVTARLCPVFQFFAVGSTTVVDGWKQSNDKCWEVTLFSCPGTTGVEKGVLV